MISGMTEKRSPGSAKTSPNDRVRDTLVRLRTGDVDVAGECDLIWDAARDGEHLYLCELARELEFSDEIRQSPLGQIGAIWSLISEIEQAILSIPGGESVETLFHFANLEQQNSLTHAPGMVERRRYFASRLAFNQPRPTLLEVMERHETDGAFQTLLFLLVHELAVQGFKDVPPLFERLHERMRACGHPLAWLPLALTDLEPLRSDPRKTRTIRQYKVYSARVQVPWGPQFSQQFDDEGSAPLSTRSAFPTGNWETTKGDDLMRIPAAVQNWKAESNGTWEARTFALHPPLASDAVGRAHFLHLHTVECLDLSTGGPRDFHFERVTAEQAFAILFRAAANGGELNEGCFGAYGRLYAWRSFAGLAGAAEHDPFERAAELARDATWFFFSARTEWFHGLAEEFGLLALRGDGKSLALLAATDTD